MSGNLRLQTGRRHGSRRPRLQAAPGFVEPAPGARERARGGGGARVGGEDRGAVRPVAGALAARARWVSCVRGPRVEQERAQFGSRPLAPDGILGRDALLARRACLTIRDVSLRVRRGGDGPARRRDRAVAAQPPGDRRRDQGREVPGGARSRRRPRAPTSSSSRRTSSAPRRRRSGATPPSVTLCARVRSGSGNGRRSPPRSGDPVCGRSRCSSPRTGRCTRRSGSPRSTFGRRAMRMGVCGRGKSSDGTT